MLVPFSNPLGVGGVRILFIYLFLMNVFTFSFYTSLVSKERPFHFPLPNNLTFQLNSKETYDSSLQIPMEISVQVTFRLTDKWIEL